MFISWPKPLAKLIITVRNFKKTAYYYYGDRFSSYFRLIYYGLLRVNTFLVYENDLSMDLPDLDLDSDFKVIRLSSKELERIREGKDLPREFYYDRIYNAKTCYVVFCGEELAYIHWVFFKDDYSRFLVLTDGVAELNYNTTLPKFRGNELMAKMMTYISRDLKESGYGKVMGVVHEFNPPAIKSMKKAGFREIARIKALGPFHRKVEVWAPKQ